MSLPPISNKRVSELVLHIRQLLQEQDKTKQKDYQKINRKIENQIDGKQNQIRQLFVHNIDSVTQHYFKYHEICSYQKKLQQMCEQFEKKIQKTQKLSQYDEEKIQKSEKLLNSMAFTKNLLSNYREHIRLIRKITINLNEEKYNNAIKLYHKAKLVKLDKLQNTPLVKCLPVIKTKIEEHLQKLLGIFWEENSSKQLELGMGCFSRIIMNQKEKLNIYQTFFGSNKNNRLSAFARNSVFARNSFVRQTVVESAKNQSTIGFLKSMNEDTESLQKFIIRANVEMAPLKQVKFLCEQLENDTKGGSSFQTLIKMNIFRNLKKIHEQIPCETEDDYKKILSRLIGFLLVVREVTSHFAIELDQNLFVGEIYSILKKEIKSIINTASTKFTIHTGKRIGEERMNDKQSEGVSILKLKEYSDVFYMILGLLKIQRNPRAYTLLLQDLLKTSCFMALQKYQAMITHQISSDNLIMHRPQSSEQEQNLDEILSLEQENDSHTNISQRVYNFTGFVVFAITIYQQSYQQMVALVKDSNCNKSLLHQQLAQILERIISLYGSQLIIKDQPLQIAQGEVNLSYCQKLYKHYSNKLEVDHNYSRTSQTTYGEKLSQLIVQLRRRIRELVEQKIQLMLSSYYSQDHKTMRSQHAEYVEWLMGYVKEVVYYMRQIKSTFVQEILYSVVTYLNYFYWQYLKQLKQYSLVTIHNLNLDLTFIYKFISQHLSAYHSITDKLKSLQEFYSFMLFNNINDITEPQKRAHSYAAIDLQTLLVVLAKYNRVNCNGLRDLKKRDLQSIIKKLQLQIK